MFRLEGRGLSLQSIDPIFGYGLVLVRVVPPSVAACKQSIHDLFAFVQPERRD